MIDRDPNLGLFKISLSIHTLYILIYLIENASQKKNGFEYRTNNVYWLNNIHVLINPVTLILFASIKKKIISQNNVAQRDKMYWKQICTEKVPDVLSHGIQTDLHLTQICHPCSRRTWHLIVILRFLQSLIYWLNVIVSTRFSSATTIAWQYDCKSFKFKENSILFLWCPRSWAY